MGHFAHVRNQLKSIHTFERCYDHIYYKVISPWKGTGPINLNKFEFPSAKDDFCKVFLKLVLEKNFFFKSQFRITSP